MKKLALVALLAVALVIQYVQPAHGLALKMQPLIYHDKLTRGEKKKGFVDISNPDSVTVRLKTSVQAFRQINDEGTLQFYNEPQVSAGLIPDLEEFELGPREAIRMYFLLDGTKLPSGDVFAALFVSTVPAAQTPGVENSLRVGTIFAIENGTPGPREAEITRLDVPFWQFGEGVRGSYAIKNTAKQGQATGFFPSSTIALDPWRQQQQVDSKLVFAGRTRQSSFELETSRIGFYKVSAAYGDSKQEKWVFMLSGYWRIVAAIVVVLSAVIVVVWRRFHTRIPLRFRH